MTIDPPPPLLPGSSNCQDAAQTRAEVAAHDRLPGSSILKSIDVRPVNVAEIASLLLERHYLRTVPAGIRHCFGVYLDAELHGAVVLTSGGRHTRRIVYAADRDRTLTLARLWLSDDLPANSESRVLGIVLRQLRRATDYKVVVTHADPAVGHTGTIYRASGWLFLGEAEPGRYLLLADGKLHHTRTVVSRFGSNRPQHLTATGVPAVRVAAPAKLRYAYVLDPAWRWRLRARVLRYPARRSCRSPPRA